MDSRNRQILTCTCEGTAHVDADALSRAGCGRIEETAHQLCRAQLDRFRAALAQGAPITLGCVQEQPLFEEVAEDFAAEHGSAPEIAFVNLRETAGWTRDAKASGPKLAALVAAAAEEGSGVEIVSLESAGVALVLGADDVAIEAATQLSENLDVTVLLAPGAQATPPRRTAFPILQGRIRRAIGHLGVFELTVDSYAAPSPSSRTRFVFDDPRDGAVSRCDLVVDLTGGTPLFPADDLRPGYFRADPRDPAAVARLIARAGQMVGTFDKPRYIDFSAELCAHSRNQKTGCTRCLDLCPTGAISPAGDVVAIDPAICAGCGQCAAACPTGAASYALPNVESLGRRIRAAIRAFRAAGAKAAPVILLHDDEHGGALIDASARFGKGLPAHVIPILVNEATQVGPELVAGALAWGAGGVRVLVRGRPHHPVDGLERTIALMETILAGTGFSPDALGIVSTDDPDALEAALAGPAPAARASVSSFLAPDDKRGFLTSAMIELNRNAPAPTTAIPLAAGAPFGAAQVNLEACTLCHACVGACPTGALSDNPDIPMLRFTESACVQCGLCEATCPEDAITLAPQLDFAAWEEPKRVVKQEEPFCCVSCGKAFGTRSSIERVQQRLSGHWMFSGPAGEKRRQVLMMCEDCRTETVVNEGFDPHDDTTRKVRTADDYRDA
ncbi:MAG: 4Fe-4S dicluster domain-containing protein [Salinarimonadaceae bacterium]|nr:MAG: 4Fe-4S dicluster domain-containing protein [Salinarimonadaceae bacterium]